MKRLSFRPHFFLWLSLGFAPEASAQMLAFETDRFGYTGSATRYSSLANARAGVGALDSVSFDRGIMSIFVTQDRSPLDVDWPYADTVWVTPAFFYTTAANTNGFPKDHPSGNNFYNGLYSRSSSDINVGRGAHVLVDRDSSETTSLSMGFGGYNAGVWDTFSISLTGANVDDSAWTAKFALDGTSNPKNGFFHEYALNVTAFGVHGTEVSPGQLRSKDGAHPTDVSGTFTGIFQQDGTSNYYAFTITLDMVNQFFDANGNPRNADLNGNYGPSIFTAPIPEPATYAAILAGLTLVVVFVRRVRAQRAAAAA